MPISRAEALRLVPSPLMVEQHRAPLLTSNIIRAVYDTYRETLADTRQLAEAFRARSRRGMLDRIFYWLRDPSVIRYKVDPKERQWAKTPSRILADGKGDCKAYTILGASIMHQLGIPHKLRVVRYAEDDFEHIYPVGILENGQEYPIDPCLDTPGRELPYTEKKDMAGYVARLAGIGAQPMSLREDIVRNPGKYRAMGYDPQALLAHGVRQPQVGFAFLAPLLGAGAATGGAVVATGATGAAAAAAGGATGAAAVSGGGLAVFGQKVLQMLGPEGIKGVIQSTTRFVTNLLGMRQVIPNLLQGNAVPFYAWLYSDDPNALIALQDIIARGASYGKDELRAIVDDCNHLRNNPDSANPYWQMFDAWRQRRAAKLQAAGFAGAVAAFDATMNHPLRGDWGKYRNTGRSFEWFAFGFGDGLDGASMLNHEWGQGKTAEQLMGALAFYGNAPSAQHHARMDAHFAAIRANQGAVLTGLQQLQSAPPPPASGTIPPATPIVPGAPKLGSDTTFLAQQPAAASFADLLVPAALLGGAVWAARKFL